MRRGFLDAEPPPASQHSPSPSPTTTSTANRDSAEELAQRAQGRFDAADDAAALRLLQKALRLCEGLESAKRLQAHIAKWGAGSTSAKAVDRVNAPALKDAHYAVMQLSPRATAAEVKKAYKQLSLELHPDRNHARGAEDAFKRLSEAFNVLSDPAERRAFDQRSGHQSHHSQQQQQQQQRGYQWQPPPPNWGQRSHTSEAEQLREQLRAVSHELASARRNLSDAHRATSDASRRAQLGEAEGTKARQETKALRESEELAWATLRWERERWEEKRGQLERAVREAGVSARSEGEREAAAAMRELREAKQRQEAARAAEQEALVSARAQNRALRAALLHVLAPKTGAASGDEAREAWAREEAEAVTKEEEDDEDEVELQIQFNDDELLRAEERHAPAALEAVAAWLLEATGGGGRGAAETLRAAAVASRAAEAAEAERARLAAEAWRAAQAKRKVLERATHAGGSVARTRVAAGARSPPPALDDSSDSSSPDSPPPMRPRTGGIKMGAMLRARLREQKGDAGPSASATDEDPLSMV